MYIDVRPDGGSVHTNGPGPGGPPPPPVLEVTLTVTADEVLGALLASPPYVAVTWCVPTPSKLVAKVAVPPLRVPVPMVDVEPLNVSEKVTLPVGDPDDPVTLAVKVTADPCVTDDGEAESVVVVGEALEATETITAEEVLPEWLESGL
jgi:hypothetical protein